MAKNEIHIKSTPASRWGEYKKKNFIPSGAIVTGFIFLLIGIAFFPFAILGLVMIGWGIYKIFKNWGEYKKKRDES